MPKAFPSETGRADTKKCQNSTSNATLSSANSKKQSAGKTSKTCDKPAKAKATPKPKVAKTSTSVPNLTDHEKKLKTKKAAAPAKLLVKKKSSPSKKEATPGSKTKMKEKAKTCPLDGKTKPKEEKPKPKPKDAKKPANVAGNSTVAKKETKKSKAESGKANPVEIPAKADSAKSANMETDFSSYPLILPPKKEIKKRKELTDAAGPKEVKKLAKLAKKDETVEKKESLKLPAEKAAENKVTKSFEMDEKCMAPKKRLKQKCAKDATINVGDIKKEIDNKDEAIMVAETQDRKHQVKFFKSKSKKGEKSKESVANSKLKDDEMKKAFSVYDNIDADSEEGNKVIKKKSVSVARKSPKEAEAKAKPAPKSKGANKSEKRKLTVDSENELCTVKPKKAKRDDATDQGVPSKKKSAAKPSQAKKNSDLSAASSDDAPLNRLIATKKTETVTKGQASNAVHAKEEWNVGSSDADAKSTKKSKAKSPNKKPPKTKPAKSSVESPKKSNTKSATERKTAEAKGKKSVRFSRTVASKPSPVKPAPVPVRKRRQRMASLNAMAMVHCLYENESKNVSVSSFESTEVSDDNTADTKDIRESDIEPETKEELKETAVVKSEAGSPDPVISRESLRSAPGVRSIGKHWDMNSETISSEMEAELARSREPIVIQEISSPDKPKSALKKKFSRSVRQSVFEDSSEEDKHQALLLEEKQRMMRRRRRQRKEMTMDLKDMVVSKRMASLNATAILAASYSSSAAKRPVPVKADAKEKKRDNAESSDKTKARKQSPFVRKKFSSSSDADAEDEADMSSNEVVVKAASSSGKQVSLIVNQDSGVTITGLYLNSTTKSTHHQGFCSISGMQYRISSTSHTQTEAATVSSEAIVRTPQEQHRPPITVSLHPEDQMSPPRNMTMPTAHPSPLKTYTPLSALSNMQPPGSPHHMHHLHHHPKTVTISSTQEISSLERHGCPSAFSAPTVYGPPPPPPPLATVATRPPYPLISKTPPDPAFVTRYYQPAGPLISHHHHHHHHHHHVQPSSTATTSTTTAATAATASSSSPSTAPTLSFAKVSRSPVGQPPTPPASNVTQAQSENSDNEMASATTPAAEITVSESAHDEPSYPVNYRYNVPANPPSFRSPSHTYQHYYPSPPSTASLSHIPQQQQQQQQHIQEVMYSGNPPPPLGAPPAPFHLGYLQPKGPPYHPPLQRRYIPALPPQQYYHHEYSASTPASQQQVIMPSHHPLTSTADYHSAPPTPSMIESYPPPPPLYYPGYHPSGPPASYYPYTSASRSLTLVETSCPCPLQGCQKNVHTGPLTGTISKGPVKRNSPLSPVALSLPKEPQDIRSLPSPARGSAGSRPTPSPAIATAKHPSSWHDGSDCGYDTAGLLTISKSSNDSLADVDSGIDASAEISPVKLKPKSCDRREARRLKTRKLKARKTVKHEICKSDEETARMHSTRYDLIENADGTGIMSAASVTEFVSRLKPTSMPMQIGADLCDSAEEQMDELVAEDQCSKRWSGDEISEPEMPKLYPEVTPPPCHKRPNASSFDGELAVKRVKLDEDGSPVDVEKNNYLSALDLCSVESKTESMAPQLRHTSQPVKIVAKPKNESDATAAAIDVDTTEDWLDGSSGAGSSASSKSRTSAAPNESKKPRFRRRRWTTKKKNKKKSNKSTKGNSEEEKLEAEKAEKRRRVELLSLTQKRAASRLKWSNGWTWVGEPFVAKVFMNTEGQEVLRTCYSAMKHDSGDIIRPKDCILLRSGCKKTDLPYIAKVAHLWEDPEDGEMMMSLFWYYRPEHTEHDTICSESPFELYASKHKDVNSVACIEDKCYVLTFNEYCRYHKSIRQAAELIDTTSVIVPPLGKKRYPRQALLPPESTSLDLVFYCRKIYDFRQHRLLKNPFFV